jgi:NADH dehydrogenase
VVDCFKQAIENRETVGQTYELGGPEKLSLDQLLGRVAESLGRKKPIVEVPMPLVRFGTTLLEALLPNPPVTTEQLTMLEEDNTCEMDEVLRAFDLEYVSLDQSIARSLRRST